MFQYSAERDGSKWQVALSSQVENCNFSAYYNNYAG